MIQNDYRLVLRSSGPELFCALFSDLNLKISLSSFRGLTGINLCPIRKFFVSDSFPALIFPCLSLRLLERKGKRGKGAAGQDPCWFLWSVKLSFPPSSDLVDDDDDNPFRRGSKQLCGKGWVLLLYLKPSIRYRGGP